MLTSILTGVAINLLSGMAWNVIEHKPVISPWTYTVTRNTPTTWSTE